MGWLRTRGDRLKGELEAEGTGSWTTSLKRTEVKGPFCLPESRGQLSVSLSACFCSLSCRGDGGLIQPTLQRPGGQRG